jgi:hypothetical protein
MSGGAVGLLESQISPITPLSLQGQLHSYGSMEPLLEQLYVHSINLQLI